MADSNNKIDTNPGGNNAADNTCPKVDNLHWYVGYTRSCQEKRVAEALQKMGVDYFLPIQKVRRKWSDRVKIIDKMVMPHTIFIHTDPNTRVKLLETIYGLVRYMSKKGPWNPVEVPQYQMDAFRLMVANTNEEVMFETRPIRPGDPVEIVNGAFAGITGEVVRMEGVSYVCVRLEGLGAALVELPAGDLVHYKEKTAD